MYGQVNCVFETDNPYEFKLTGTSTCLASSSSAMPADKTSKPGDANAAVCECQLNAIYEFMGCKKERDRYTNRSNR